MKASDLNLWATETDEKVQENLYKDYPDQLPHPVGYLTSSEIIPSSGRMMLERLLRSTSRRDFPLALERCTSGSALRRWRTDCGKHHLFCLTLKCLIFLFVFIPTITMRHALSNEDFS